MKKNHSLIRSAVTGILALAAATATLSAIGAEPAQEKCYGIVKAGMNDCQTSTESCASSATKDSQPDAFILLPKGTCAKIVGGSLNPKSDKKTK